MNKDGLVEKNGQKGTKYFEDASGEIVAKKCCRCGEIKTLGEYAKHKTKLAGRNSECKKCTSERGKLRRKNNPEYYKKLNRQRYEENPEYFKEHQRNWREVNKERKAEIERNYRIKNPEKIAIKGQRRRARKTLLPDTITFSKYESTLEFFNYACALTGDTVNIHADHFIAISTGHAGTTYENMIPLRADLNASKGDRNPFDWFFANKDRFNLEQERFDRLVTYLANINELAETDYKEYVFECFTNPRSIDEIIQSNDETA